MYLNPIQECIDYNGAEQNEFEPNLVNVTAYCHIDNEKVDCKDEDKNPTPGAQVNYYVSVQVNTIKLNDE